MTQTNYHHRPFPTYVIPRRNRQNTTDHNRQSCSVLLIQWPHQQLYLTNRKRPLLVGIEKLREVSRKKSLKEFIRKKNNQKFKLKHIYTYTQKVLHTNSHCTLKKKNRVFLMLCLVFSCFKFSPVWFPSIFGELYEIRTFSFSSGFSKVDMYNAMRSA